jgi:Fe-S-cluster containining protein
MKHKIPKRANKSAKRKERKRMADVSQCARCQPAKCCMYFSLEIDRPTTKRDYDDFMWFLAHENVSIYLWNKSWYLMVHNRCVFLDRKTNLCSIYDTRPAMCREHAVEECEFDSDYEFDEHFKSRDDLTRWMKKKKLLK